MCLIPQYTNYYNNLAYEPVINQFFIFGAYNRVLVKGKTKI